MTSTTSPTIQETFDATTLRRLAQAKGVCLSFFLPDQRPGTSTGNHQATLRQLVREARATVSSESLEPLDALVDDHKLAAGGQGLAIFCSAQVVECLRVPGIEKAEFAVTGQFELAPLLLAAFAPREQFILGISKKKMRLCHWKDGVATEVPLPKEAPLGLDEAEHGRAETVGNHPTAGLSSSTMSSAQFGSENRVDREGAGHHLSHFFRMVDTGLAPVLNGVPLLLGGVEDEILAYRKAAHYRAISTQEIRGSIEHMTLSEIAARAHAAVVEDFFAEGGKALAACRANKALTDPEAILIAADAGRVHQLIVPEGHSKEMVNAAVAATLRMGGEVLVVHTNEMPDESMVAALRY